MCLVACQGKLLTSQISFKCVSRSTSCFWLRLCLHIDSSAWERKKERTASSLSLCFWSYLVRWPRVTLSLACWQGWRRSVFGRCCIMVQKAIGMTPSSLKPQNSSEVEDFTFKQSSQLSSDNSLKDASVLVSLLQWLRLNMWFLWSVYLWKQENDKVRKILISALIDTLEWDTSVSDSVDCFIEAWHIYLSS